MQPTKPKTVRCYTTAEAAYDWGWTREIAPVAAHTTGTYPKVVRLVEIEAERADAQRARYSSGLHLVADTVEFAKLLGYGLVVLARIGEGVSP
jgi:hypothetical protein